MLCNSYPTERSLSLCHCIVILFVSNASCMFPWWRERLLHRWRSPLIYKYIHASVYESNWKSVKLLILFPSILIAVLANELLTSHFSFLLKQYIYKDYNIKFWAKLSPCPLFKISLLYLHSAENHQTTTDFPIISNLDIS